MPFFDPQEIVRGPTSSWHIVRSGTLPLTSRYNDDDDDDDDVDDDDDDDVDDDDDDDDDDDSP